MSNTRETFFNQSQSLIHIVNANVTHNLWPRGEGKTSGGSGRRIIHLSQVMPRSQCIIYTDTFKRSEEVLIPNMLNFISEEMGLIEEHDFVRFKKPPSHWVKPLIQPHKFDRVVSFSTGFVLCCGASKEDGSVNGFNGQSAIIEETKYVDRKRIKSQLYKALRGSLKHFGHLPEYRSVWSFTDKYEGDIGWLLKLRDKQDDKLIKAVLSMQLEVWRLKKEMQQFTSTATLYKYRQVIFDKEQKLNAIRRELVFICDAKPFANKEILGAKFYRDAKRDCDTIFEYNVAILNKDPDQVENTFYPALSRPRHFHKQMEDTNEDQPLIAAMDYQFRITPMVVGQFGIIPGRSEITLNIVNGIHTLFPEGGIEKTVKAFCEYYKDRTDKTVYYCYDHTATGKRPDGKSFKDIAVAEWTNTFDDGRLPTHDDWNVIEVHMGAAPFHDIKMERIKMGMEQDKVMFNEVRAQDPLTSIKHAGAYMSNGKTKKNKSGEKKNNNDPVQQTDYSDAFDQLYWAVIELEMVSPYQSNRGFVGDISTR